MFINVLIFFAILQFVRAFQEKQSECNSLVSLMQYNYTSYNSLSHVHDSRHLKLEDKASALGEIVVQYGLESDVSVGRLHKHFNLLNDEAVVMTTGNQSLWNKVSTFDSTLIPLILRFDQSQDNWMPIQFGSKELPFIADRLRKVLSNPLFLNEFSMKLKELNVVDELGINIFVTDIFKLPPDELLFEGTRGDTREQVMVPVNYKYLTMFPKSKEGLYGASMPEVVMYDRYVMVRTYWSFKSVESENGSYRIVSIDEGMCVICSSNSDHHFVPCPDDDTCLRSENGKDPLLVSDIIDDNARSFVRSLYHYENYLPGFDPHTATFSHEISM